MKKVEQFLEKYLMPLAAKLGQYKFLAAIRDGIVLSMPLIIFGSILLVISNFPITAWTDWLGQQTTLMASINHAINASFGIMGLISAFGIARVYADSCQEDGVSAGLISLSAWLILTPNVVDKALGEGVPVTFLGSRGLFVGLVVGLFSGWLFQKLVKKNLVIKMPDGVPPAVSKSFVALIPAAIILGIAFAVQLLTVSLKIDNVHLLLAEILGGPLGILSGSVGGAVVCALLNSLFWFAGIHGGNIVGSVMNPILLMNTDANRLAYQNGQDLPHIITSSFFDMFVYIGGGGSTLALVAIVFFLSKSKQGKVVGGLSLVPGIFNINEPAMFGIPIVFNMSLVIPFVLAPVANVLIAYAAISSGIVARTIGIAVPWTMPPIISGFLATNSITGAILQVVIIAVDLLIYYPFYRAIDKAYLADEVDV